MKHIYTAEIYFEDGEIMINTADDIEELVIWINNQAESTFGQTKAKIIDNHTQHIVKVLQFNSSND